MSEREPSIFGDPEKIAKALGSEEPIYIGPIGPADVIHGGLFEKVRRALERRRQAQSISSEDPEPEPPELPPAA